MDWKPSSQSVQRKPSTRTADFINMYNNKAKAHRYASPTDSSDASSDGDGDVEWIPATRRKGDADSRANALRARSSDAESGTTKVKKHNSYLRPNIGWQPKQEYSQDSDVTILCSSTSNSSSLDAEHGATKMKNGKSRAKIGSQPMKLAVRRRNKQTSRGRWSNDNSSNSDSSESESDFTPRANIGWLPRHELINQDIVKTSSSDTGSIPFRKITSHWQPKLEPPSSKRNRGVALADDSSNSSSSDSESLLSPHKPRSFKEEPFPLAQRIRVRNQLRLDFRTKRFSPPGDAERTSDVSLLRKASKPQQIIQTEVPNKRLENASLSQGFSPNGKHSLQQLNRGKRCLKETEQAATLRYKRARVLHSDPSSRSSGNESSPEQKSSSVQTRNKPRKMPGRFRENTEHACPRKTSRQTILDLFGKASSDDDGDVTEEDTEDVTDEHEDELSSKSTTSIPVDLLRDTTTPDDTQSKQNQAAFSNQEAYSVPQKTTSSSSRRDDTVVLVDITQSEERGALSGQASPKLKRNLISKISEGSSPVFPRQVIAKSGPTIGQDNGSYSQPLVIGEVQLNLGNTTMNSHWKSLDTPRESHLVLGVHSEDQQHELADVFPRSSHLIEQASHQKSASHIHGHIQPKSLTTDRSSPTYLSLGRVRNNPTEMMSSTAEIRTSAEAFKAGTSSSKQETTSTIIRDDSHVSGASFEENRYQWLLQTKKSVQIEVLPKSQLQSVGMSYFTAGDQSMGHSTGQAPAGTTRNPGSGQYGRVDNSASSPTALNNQGKSGSTLQPEVQIVGFRGSQPRVISVDGSKTNGPRQHHVGINSLSSTTKHLQPDVQIIQKSQQSTDAYRLPAKLRRKVEQGRPSSHQTGDVESQGSGQKRRYGESGSPTTTRKARASQPVVLIVESQGVTRKARASQPDVLIVESQGVTRKARASQPDVLIVESQGASNHHRGRPSGMGKQRQEELISRWSVSPEVAKRMKQLEDDEAMARQLSQTPSANTSQPVVQIVENPEARRHHRRRASGMLRQDKMPSGPTVSPEATNLVKQLEDDEAPSASTSQPAVQIVENPAAKLHHRRRTSGTLRQDKMPSGRTASPEATNLVKQIKDDEAMARQLSQTLSPSTSQPSVQIIENQDAGRHHEGEPSGKARRRRKKVASGRPLTPDVAKLVKQLDEDEAMARQLQEQFDSELARMTQENNAGIEQVSFQNVGNPGLVPTPSGPSQFLPFPQPTMPDLRPWEPPYGIPWREDVGDMNISNAAVFAQMGRFLADNMEMQAGRHPNVRVRRGRGRGRGRARVGGHHHHNMPLPMVDGNDYETLWSLTERVGPAVCKGLPEASINLLPTFLYTPGTEVDERECSICMSDYEAGENLRRLPCFHFYHAECIDKWFKENQICPVCREAVKFDAVNFT